MTNSWQKELSRMNYGQLRQLKSLSRTQKQERIAIL